MTLLAPMQAQTYAAYVAAAVAGYAEENVTAGRWPAAGARARAQAAFDSLLPQGLATAGQHLFDIRSGPGGATVGHLWVALETRHGVCSAFVYDLVVAPAHRRRGHARAAFLALEPIVAALGAGSIGLHVFSHNTGAQTLYQALGYRATGINMHKPLAAPDPAG